MAKFRFDYDDRERSESIGPLSRKLERTCIGFSWDLSPEVSWGKELMVAIVLIQV